MNDWLGAWLLQQTQLGAIADQRRNTTAPVRKGVSQATTQNYSIGRAKGGNLNNLLFKRESCPPCGLNRYPCCLSTIQAVIIDWWLSETWHLQTLCIQVQKYIKSVSGHPSLSELQAFLLAVKVSCWNYREGAAYCVRLHFSHIWSQSAGTSDRGLNKMKANVRDHWQFFPANCRSSSFPSLTYFRLQICDRSILWSWQS